MHEHGKSDSPVVPAMPPNKAKAAEAAEERGLAEGNTDDPTRPGRSAGSGVPSGLDRVREVSRRDKEARFTALLHHVSLERLVMAYWALSPKASPGVDGVTWQDYGQDLVANLRDLHDRVHSGRYRARGSRTSGCCGWLISGWPRESSRTGDGRRLRRVLRKGRRFRRCWRTFTCTMSSTCGPTGGGVTWRAAR